MYLTNRIKLHYKNILYQDLLLKNVNNVVQPTISEIIVSISSKKVLIDHVLLLSYINSLNLITGQIPTKTKSRKSIANFKLRSSQLMGCKVNLRGKRCEYFIDKLLSIVFPKIREFEYINGSTATAKKEKTTGDSNKINNDQQQLSQPCGLTSPLVESRRSIIIYNSPSGLYPPGRGSITISLKDLFLFPELEENYDLFENLNGIDITFITTAKSKEETLLLLSGFQLPVLKT